MKATTKIVSSVCSAFVFCSVFANGAYLGTNYTVTPTFSIVASAEDSETSLPDERPTSTCAVTSATAYTVPVYIYNKDGTGASMANEAIDHSAKLVVANGKYYITIGFHPITMDGLIGHLQKFYYYNMTSDEYYSSGNEAKESAKTEIIGDSCVKSFDDLGDDDESTYSEYISQVTFELPTKESDVVCRVKVDAMGETEQEAVLVFDYAKIKYNMALYLAERIEYAESISNDDDIYTSSSYSALQSAISTAKTTLSRFSTNLTMLNVRGIKLVDNALSNLVVKDSVLSNGIYSVPIDYRIAEYTKINDAYPCYLAGENSSTYLNDLFGTTAQIIAEDGKYTLKITAQSNGEDYYLFNLVSGGYGAASLTFGGQWSDVDYFGRNQKLICEGDYIQASFGNRYAANDMIVNAQVYSKTTETSSPVRLTSDNELIAIDLDWDNISFVQNLPLNKDELDSKVRYASSRLLGDMSAYTDVSVSAYRTAYENAKAINEDDTVTQATVDSAAVALNNAAAALEQKVSLAGYTAELADYVGLNYYLNISDELKAQSPSVKFTFGDAEPQIVTFDKAVYVTTDDFTGYKFTAKLDPKNMTDTVTAEVYVGDEKVSTTAATMKKLSTTIKAYADTIIANADSKYSDKAIAAAKTMLNYGGYSQTLFNYNTDALANASLDSTDVSSVTADTLTNYVPKKTGSDNTAKFTGYNLYLDSLTSMRFYYTGDVKVSSNAENFTTGTSGNKNYVEIAGITPVNLLNGYDVTIGGMTIHASPASYAHTALTKSSDENLQNAMKAMILYSQAASAYDTSLNK